MRQAVERIRIVSLSRITGVVFSSVLAFVACSDIAAVLAVNNSFLTPMGPVAEAQRAHFLRVILITMIAIMPVMVGVPLILWRYHHRRRDAAYRPGNLYRPNWEFSGPLEAAMWGIPFIIISVLSWWLWHETVRIDPYVPMGPAPLEVQIIGLDWKWLFLYPELGIATLGAMAVPVGRPVRVSLTTDTVMQSFRISALAGQIYAMPGMRTELNFVASQPGVARGEKHAVQRSRLRGADIHVACYGCRGLAELAARAR